MTIKAILFDADGVVIQPPFLYAGYLERACGITREGTRYFFTGEFIDCLKGKTELRKALEAHLPQWGWEAGADAFVDLWLLMEDRVDERLMGRIQSLRAAGYVCGLATLQERNRAEYMRNQMGFSGLFDGLFFSCEVGWVKPEMEYYRAVQERLGLQGGEILFWDDSMKNVKTARQFGWQAEFYSGFEDFDQKLQDFIGNTRYPAS